MYWCFSSCVPDPEWWILRDWGEHIFVLWIIKSHVVYLVLVSLEVSLLFQLTIPNRMKPHSIVSASSDKVSTTVIPANRVYGVWTTSTVRIWLKVVPINPPFVWWTFHWICSLRLEVDQAHGCKFFTIVWLFHFKIVIRIVVTANCRWKRRSSSTFHNFNVSINL